MIDNITNNNPTIAISFTEGRVVRDLFYNGLFEQLLSNNFSILLVTPAARVDEFVQEWSKLGVQFLTLPFFQPDKTRMRMIAMRRHLKSLGWPVMKWWIGLEPKFTRKFPELENNLKIRNCKLVVVTNPIYHSEFPIISAAVRQNIPTLGIIRSWDNFYKGLRFYPDYLTVWNNVNHQEACQLMGYPSNKVFEIGGTQFDPYFSEDASWSREQFSASINLDPTRPILTLATLGSFLDQYDETYVMDILLEAIRQRLLPEDLQLICRLHPSSRVEQFQKYLKNPNVRLSYITGYIPSLGWSMTRQDVIWTANLLRHSNVVVSPGSTITIETAIFDTPTVVPVFHTYQPELGAKQYQFHLSKHFKRLVDCDLLAIVHSPEGLIQSVNRALIEPSWYRAQRAQLVKDYIHFTDGKSSQRLGNIIQKLARREVN